jgi:myo-inositol-1(or 4)-monophosphatase
MIEGTDKTHTWIVDPLDGTTNFMHAIPHFAVNIALQREGEVVSPASPTTRSPTTCSGSKRARAPSWAPRSACASPPAAPWTRASWPPACRSGKPGHGQFLKELHQISQKVAGVRRFGSAALDLAWVAAGRFDGYWERNLNAWDVAAGVLLVTGGRRQGLDDRGERPRRRAASRSWPPTRTCIR